MTTQVLKVLTHLKATMRVEVGVGAGAGVSLIQVLIISLFKFNIVISLPVWRIITFAKLTIIA